MTNRYPLHHEDARPLYLEITQDEYDRIMTENRLMKEILKQHGITLPMEDT
jgi:sRNA-binding protein